MDKQNEKKSDRFKRIASLRTQKVLNTLRLLGNCSNKSTYEYSGIEVRKIFNAIESEVRRIKFLIQNNNNKNFQL